MTRALAIQILLTLTSSATSGAFKPWAELANSGREEQPQFDGRGAGELHLRGLLLES